VFLFLAVVLAVFADPLFVHRTFLGRDMAVYFAAIEKAVHSAWAGGHLPVWWENVSGGRPLLPNPNAGVFYPLRVAGALLPFPLFFKLFPIVHVALAGLGMYLLVRRWGRSPEGAWVAAVSYAFCGAALSLIFFLDFLPGYALLPFMLWAAARLGDEPSPRAAAVFALIVAVAILGGDIFTTALGLAGSLLYLLLDGRGRRSRVLGWAFVACVVAAACAGMQVVPTLLWVGETDRALGRLTIANAFHWTLHPVRLLEFVVPYPFGKTATLSPLQTWGGRFFDHRPVGYFLTLFAGGIAAVGLAEELRPARPAELRAPRSMKWLLALSVLLAVSGLFIPDRASQAPSPVPLRFPEKFIMGAELAVAVFAGFAWDRRLEKRKVLWPWVLAGALGLAAAASLAPGTASLVVAWTGAEQKLVPVVARELPVLLLWGGFHWVLASTALTLRARRSPGYLGVAALALVLADILVATRPIAVTDDERLLTEAPPAARAMSSLDPERRYCHFSLFDALPNEAQIQGALPPRELIRRKRAILAGVSGSEWGRPMIFNVDPDVSDLFRAGAVNRILWNRMGQDKSAVGRIAPFLEGFSVRFILRSDEDPRLPGARTVARAEPVVIDELPDAVARIRLATRWIEFKEPVAVWKRMVGQEDPPDLALLETGRDARGAAAPGALRVLAEAPSGFLAETSGADPSWLVVSRGYWNWRSVTVDGRKGDVVPERFALSALFLPAGRHRVVWRELVPGGAAGIALSAAGLLVVLLLYRRDRAV
jgi:hypothetical protein